MRIPFHKYQGTGNDFVMIDNRDGLFDKSNLDAVQQLCDRRFGIGADGVILVENHPDCDFEMIYYNSDGSQSFCGNGSRCTVAFCKSLGIIETHTTFLAIDGMHEATIEGDIVSLKMGNVSEVEAGDDYYFIDTGSPHYIMYTDNVADADVVAEGQKIRYNERFKAEGTNVNLVQKNGTGVIVRTYERGVEDETLSCGTGVTAVALSAAVKGLAENECAIKVQGGQLKVKFNRTGEQSFDNIWLIGPGTFVYKGEVDV
jgi:diaminopimelate epimerase